MAVIKKEQSIFQTIFAEALASKWLAAGFFINGFFTGFLLPTENLESGYTMHHFDFIYGLSGAFSLLIFRFLFKKPTSKQLLFSGIFSAIFANIGPYIWATLILPHGYPQKLADKWLYSFNGPIGQVVLLALLVGAIRYGQSKSNAVAENRLALNYLRSNMKQQISNEREEILAQIKEKLEPALAAIDSTILSGAERKEISEGINSVINDVVRPLSHELDASASAITELNLTKREIKRDFAKKRFRRRLKGIVPLHLASNLPLAVFCYVNFNLSVISYLNGFSLAARIGTPFLIIAAGLHSVFSRYAKEKRVKVLRALFFSIAISIVDSVSFYLLTFYSGDSDLKSGSPGLAFSVFILTLGPAVFSMILFNMRANIQAEETLNYEIAHDLSQVRRQLWAIRKKFAREIHGGLQSKLQVLALKLNNSQGSNAEPVKDFYQELELNLSEDSQLQKPLDLKSYLSDLIDFWDGVVAIKVEVDSHIHNLIADDYFLVECMQEVIREAVNNAIKHGKSKEIAIKINQSDTSTINLIVVNSNNIGIEKDSIKPSLGISIFKDLSKSWKLSFDNEHTTLSVEFALN